MRNVFIITAIVFFSSFVFAQPSATKLFCDKKVSIITYSMNHTLHAWTGECKDVTSVILYDKSKNSISSVAVSVKLASFDSKNANRDSHMIEVVEGLKYPTITFTSNQIVQDNNNLTVTGILTFHGVNQTITFLAVKTSEGNKITVSGNFNIKMSQFKIDAPTLIGIKTDDEIKLQFNVVY